MLPRIKSSLLLLVFLGILFAIPVTAKTFSAHGFLAAFGTGLLVIVAVILGPFTFALDGWIERNIAVATSVASDTQVWVLLAIGVVLILTWLTQHTVNKGHALPYIPTTCWALVGAYFCILHVFSHTT